MANPPFNVDPVDALRIKLDPRLPFGMPGVSKGSAKNGNCPKEGYGFLWQLLFPPRRCSTC
jgi:hypothetical protein